MYKGEIVCKDKDKDKEKIQQYVGLCEPTFKERYGAHISVHLSTKNIQIRLNSQRHIGKSRTVSHTELELISAICDCGKNYLSLKVAVH